MSGSRAVYSLAAHQSPPISFREYPSSPLNRNSPAATARILSLSLAALAIPAPFCFLDLISARFQIPSQPVPSCSDLQRVAPAKRVPRPAADIPIASALFQHIP